MKIFKKVKNGNKRKIYFCGIRIWKYKEKAKSIILKRPTNPILQRNKELHNIATNKPCFVLATGPSINEQDLTKLEGKDCFSISNFFLHKDIKIIKPKLHFFAPYHEPLILENYIDWLRLADKKLPQETNIVLGLANYGLAKKYNLFPNRKIYYLDLLNTWDINTDLTKQVIEPQTGPIMILPVLDYMGYSEINLIGQDMNRLKDYQGTTQNFYKNDPRKNATDGAAWEDIIVELKRTCKMFEQFKAYNDYFKSKGKKLINLSPDSWLSFIEKKDFNNIMEKANDK